jgi:hypothetical protein
MGIGDRKNRCKVDVVPVLFIPTQITLCAAPLINIPMISGGFPEPL